MEEGLFVQFDKIANSILNSKSKEQRIFDSQSAANTKQIPENGGEVKTECCKQPGGCLRESATPVMKVKALQVNKTVFFEQLSPFPLCFPNMFNLKVQCLKQFEGKKGGGQK